MHTRHPLLGALVLVSAMTSLCGTAHAASSASTDLTLSISFQDAVFSGGQFDGLPAEADLDYEFDTFGYWETFPSTVVNSGTGHASGSASLLAGGQAPDGFGEFQYLPGDDLVMTLHAQADATGTGSDYSYDTRGQASLYFQSYSDDDIILSFSYDFARSATFSNDAAGNHTISLLDATATDTADSTLETSHFIDGNGAYNIGYSLAGTITYDDGHPGQILLTLPAGEYAEIAFAADLGANAAVISAVPENDTWALMLAGLGMLGLTARRRRQT